VVWIDSDIYINPAAPSVVDGDGARADRCGGRAFLPDAGSPPGRSPEQHRQGPGNRRHEQAVLDRLPRCARLARGRRASENRAAHRSNRGAGAFAATSPRAARARLRLYKDDGLPSHNYEMRYLSHEIQAGGLVHWIDPRFNFLAWWVIQLTCMKTGREPNQAELQCFLMESYLRNHFLHFAGIGDLMPMIGFIGG
jgi:hypothetical protein